MKTFTKLLTILTAVTVFAASCINEDPAYKGEPEPTPTDETGFVALGGMSMEVIYDDQTEVEPDDTSDVTKKALPTRADPDVNDFIVEIFDADNVSILKKTYAELKQELTEPMALKVGTYRMEVVSEETIPAVEWEHPSYGATRSFSVLKAQTTTIEEVVCTLRNIKVTVACAEELAGMLSDTTTATVSLGANEIGFVKGETRAAYFKAVEAENTLNFLLEGTFADTGEPVTFSKTITNVKAGQWRRIELVIEYADKGGMKFNISVDSFIQDEKIDVNGTENLWETVIEDNTDVPTVEWPGHDLTQPFKLTDAMFDEDGNCIEPFGFNFTSPNGIESLTVSISSTSSAFMASLASIQIPASFDLCTLSPSSPAGIILKGFGYPLGDEIKGRKMRSFDIAGQMSLLYGFDGTHTFSFRVIDINGRSMTAALTLIVDKGTSQQGPVIDWIGYDLSKIYELNDVSDIKVDISAEAGIKSFIISIISDDLHPLLEMVAPELTAPFDLVTITGDSADFLAELGFPLGDEVSNKTSLLFDITLFIDVLKDIPSASGGTSTKFDFKLDITDNNGVTSTATIQLKHDLE